MMLAWSQETLSLFSNGSNWCRFMHLSIQYSTIGGLPSVFHCDISSLLLPVALLWYDYALTWTREVQYFWTKRFTLSTALYILCRYGMVTSVLSTLALVDKLSKLRVRLWSIENRSRTNAFICTQYITLLRTSFLTGLTWLLYFSTTVVMQGFEFPQFWVFWVE